MRGANVPRIGRWYTSLLGKASSIAPIHAKLRRHDVSCYKSHCRTVSTYRLTKLAHFRSITISCPVFGNLERQDGLSAGLSRNNACQTYVNIYSQAHRYRCSECFRGEPTTESDQNNFTGNRNVPSAFNQLPSAASNKIVTSRSSDND